MRFNLNIFFAAAILAAAVGATSIAVEAEDDMKATTTTKCASYSTSTTCSQDPECQWFLNQCIDKAQVDCTAIKDKTKCKSTPGCQYYNDPQWWSPPKMVKNNYGNFRIPKIGCDTNTMCDRLLVSDYCNKYSHCTFVDGACKTFGTPPDPNWVADCTKFQPRIKKYCDDLAPQCKYVNLRVCENGKNCQNVRYGCRRSNWCSVEGFNPQKQCKLLGGGCQWQDDACVERPTVAPSHAPTGKPTTRAPSKAPTKMPTSKAPTTSPTQKPRTAAPTRPTTLAPTFAPTHPTTHTPTLKPTTKAPTKPLCPITTGTGSIKCPNQPFAELVQTFPVPDSQDPTYYCTQLCAQGGAQGSFGVPVFPGCRSWTYDGVQCSLFGCYPSGTGVYQANVDASVKTTNYGVLSPSCYPSGQLPTTAPTTTCVYSNKVAPPNEVPNRKPIEQSCRLGNATISLNFAGNPRSRLNWCQESCTNLYEGCTGVEMYELTGTGIPARCIFAKCLTPQSSPIARTIYRSAKTDTCN